MYPRPDHGPDQPGSPQERRFAVFCLCLVIGVAAGVVAVVIGG